MPARRTTAWLTSSPPFQKSRYCTIKFHNTLHLYDFLRYFGSLGWCNTTFHETKMKQTAKKPFPRTTRQRATFLQEMTASIERERDLRVECLRLGIPMLGTDPLTSYPHKRSRYPLTTPHITPIPPTPLVTLRTPHSTLPYQVLRHARVRLGTRSGQSGGTNRPFRCPT